MENQNQREVFIEGIRVVPNAVILDASTTFNGIYMRPSIANGGTIPATGDFCFCPDIWPSGTTPINNFTTALATSDSYNTNSPSTLDLGQTNLFYIRAYNGGTAASSVAITVYYVPDAIIQWPSEWQNNIIQTDQGNTSGSITNLAPGTVGVSPQTWAWPNVPSPPNGSDHYCIITQMVQPGISNPFPSITSQLDLSALIMNNLQWGWHNLPNMVAQTNVWSYTTSLQVTSDMQPGTYQIIVNPIGFVGWQIGFTCTEVDSNGNQIQLDPTFITANNNGYASMNYLAAGYSAMVTVSMYNPNNVAQSPQNNAPIQANFLHTGPNAQEAIDRGLVNWRATNHYLTHKSVDMPHGILTIMGQDNGQVQTN